MVEMPRGRNFPALRGFGICFLREGFGLYCSSRVANPHFVMTFWCQFSVSSLSTLCAFNMRHTAKMVLKTAGPREKLVSVLVSVGIVLWSNFLQLYAK